MKRQSKLLTVLLSASLMMSSFIVAAETDYVPLQTFSTADDLGGWTAFTDSTRVTLSNPSGYLKIVNDESDGRGGQKAVVIPSDTTDIRIEGEFFTTKSTAKAYLSVLNGNTKICEISDFLNATSTINHGNVSGSTSTKTTANFTVVNKWYKVIIDLHYDATNGNTQTVTFINDNNVSWSSGALPFVTETASRPNTIRILPRKDATAEIRVRNFRVYTPDTSVATSVEISGESSVWIPLTNSAQTTYTASVKDQNGAVMADETVEWALLNYDETAYTGENVQISDGVVTVDSFAATENIKIKATLSDNAAVSVTKDVELTYYYANDTFTSGLGAWSAGTIDGGALKVDAATNATLKPKRNFKSITTSGGYIEFDIKNLDDKAVGRRLTFSEDGSDSKRTVLLGAYNGKAFPGLPGGTLLETGNWYNVKIHLNQPAKTYDIYITGIFEGESTERTVVSTGRGYVASASLFSTNCLIISETASESEGFLLDNFKVVPYDNLFKLNSPVYDSGTVPVDNGTITGFNIKKYAPHIAKSELFIATYDKQTNALINVCKADINDDDLDFREDGSVIANLDLPGDASACYIKAFVFNNTDTLKPLAISYNSKDN